jgi:hypothetical protein
MVKMASFSIQTVKFIFKQLNLNSNGSITCRHTATALWPQWQPLVQAVTSGTAPTRVLLLAPAYLLRYRLLSPPR